VTEQFKCTGKGNEGGGCGAILLVEQGDLYHTYKHCYDGSSETFTTFTCNQCGVETDIEVTLPSSVKIRQTKGTNA
jgi:hypothetical protein